jgi:hypothetical protein
MPAADGVIDMKPPMHVLFRAPAWWALPLALAAAGCLDDRPRPDPDDDGMSDTGDSDDSDGTDDGPGLAGNMVEMDDVVTPIAARGTILGGNATGVHGCDRTAGPGYNQYEQLPEAGASQLHVVSVLGDYDAALANEDQPVNQLAVHVTRPGSSVLFLTGYGASHWTVSAEPSSAIERVVLNGYYAQSADVPDGVPVDIFSEAQNGHVLGNPFAIEWPSILATNLVEAAEDLTGATLTSFRGCYTSTSFQIDEPGEITPPHVVSDATQPAILRGCDRLTSESSYCMAMSDQGVLDMLGLDTGDVCYGQLPVLQWANGNSLGWRGDYLYTCMYQRGVARMSLVDGTIDIAPIACDNVTTFDGGLVGVFYLPTDAEPFGLGALMVFDTFEDVARHAPSRMFAHYPYSGRLAFHGNRAYFAWHSTHTVESAVLVDGAKISSLPLEGFDDWILGLDVTDDGRLVIGGDERRGGIHFFDAGTGELQGLLDSPYSSIHMGGLKCISGPAHP